MLLLKLPFVFNLLLNYKLNFFFQNTLSEEYIIQQLKSFKGPFAMIYLDKINKKIYFMRDRIGRSTLLFHKSKNSIIISNVLGRNYNCVEVPATCIQILNLNTNTIKVYPWDNNELKTEEYLIEDWLEQLKMQQSLPDDEFYFEYIEEQFKENVITFILNDTFKIIKKM